MSDLTRAEIEEFWETWLEVNRQAERIADWRIMADWYAEDATYGWMYSPDEHFMAVGREQIRDWAIGIEMDNLDGWHYDYVCTLIDEQKSMVLGFWKQRSGILDDAGKEYEILGLGGSWFGVERQVGGADDGRLKFAWQRDWFDMPSTAHTFMEILAAGKAPETLVTRMSQGGLGVPGHYRYADIPSPVWPPPVEAGEFVTQAAVPVVSTGRYATGSTSEMAIGSASEMATGSTSEMATGSASEKATGSTSEMATGSTSEMATGSTSEMAAGSTSERAAGSASEMAIGSTSEMVAGSASEMVAGSASEVADGSTDEEGVSA